MIITELEALTGIIARGDITPLVYTWLKTSPHKEEILKYRKMVSSKEHIQQKELPKEETIIKGVEFVDWLADFL